VWIVIEKSVSLPVESVTKSLPFIIQTFPIIMFILIDHRTPKVDTLEDVAEFARQMVSAARFRVICPYWESNEVCKYHVPCDDFTIEWPSEVEKKIDENERKKKKKTEEIQWFSIRTFVCLCI
jgi:hypothetical protein